MGVSVVVDMIEQKLAMYFRRLIGSRIAELRHSYNLDVRAVTLDFLEYLANTRRYNEAFNVSEVSAALPASRTRGSCRALCVVSGAIWSLLLHCNTPFARLLPVSRPLKRNKLMHY